MNLSKFFNSFLIAGQGIKYAWSHEQNFKIKLLIGVIVGLLMFVVDITFVERIILATFIFLVLALELLNTAVEHLSDLVESKFHEKIKVVKDLMAASVLVISIGAVIVGIAIFYTPLIERFFY